MSTCHQNLITLRFILPRYTHFYYVVFQFLRGQTDTHRETHGQKSNTHLRIAILIIVILIIGCILIIIFKRRLHYDACTSYMYAEHVSYYILFSTRLTRYSLYKLM